jgi:hypothetical protein
MACTIRLNSLNNSASFTHAQAASLELDECAHGPDAVPVRVTLLCFMRTITRKYQSIHHQQHSYGISARFDPVNAFQLFQVLQCRLLTLVAARCPLQKAVASFQHGTRLHQHDTQCTASGACGQCVVRGVVYRAVSLQRGALAARCVACGSHRTLRAARCPRCPLCGVAGSLV